MDDIWDTKDGRRRVRRDPPTLEEAALAAQGLTTDPDEQIEIVASLMEVAAEEARAAVLRLGRSREVERVTVTGRIGAPRAGIVERRTPRFAVPPRRSMAREASSKGKGPPSGYSQRRLPGSEITRLVTRRCQTNRTTMAPITAPISPPPSSRPYQPTAWPMNVATNAPAIPSRVVRIKPAGLFGPGASMRAIMPATKPIMMIQIMCMATSTCGPN